MTHIVETSKPHEWTEQEAVRSGRGGYRIGVELSGNPFKGVLGGCWEKGWKDAAAEDTTSKKRVDYSEEKSERPHGKTRFSSSDRRGTDISRPRTIGFPVRNTGGRNTSPNRNKR